MQNIDLEIIQDRQRELAKQMEILRAEAEELEITIRVLTRLSKVPTTQANGQSMLAKLGPPRPENTPSLFEMTETVIRDAIASGSAGLRGTEIVAEIGKRFWPGVQGRQVLPPIYGFVKNGRLQKNKDGIFRPIQK